MLKWAKGSKNGGHGPGQFGSAGRVSLADLRRASAKLLRRKDSSSKSKNTTTPMVPKPVQSDSSPPPLVPPRGSSTTTSTHPHQGVIKQATVRRMSTLRHQNRSASPIRRPGSSSSSSSSTSSSSSSSSFNEICQERRNRIKKPLIPDGDNSSSLYMQLDQIPVAVQHCVNNSKRKALEDISNQAYRHIITSLQDELAQLADDETRTLAEATLLPMNQMEVSVKKETEAKEESTETASFTSQPPNGDLLHRPRAVHQPSEESSAIDLAVLMGHHFSTPSVKKACQHTSTGQHLHQQCPARSLSHGLPVVQQPKSNSKTTKSVTFNTEARLIGTETKLPVVFETDQEEDGNSNGSVDTESLMPGFINIPCSRRGFCLELDGLIVDKLDSSCDPDDQVDGGSGPSSGRGVASPDGYDWQPSYVNLEDTEIAPVLLASSRPADDSSDFWKPRSVASGGSQKNQSNNKEEEISSLGINHKSVSEDNPLLMEFPGFRYAIQLPAASAVLERRSISNGSSGSDTQDSGVAEMAHQPLSLSRAASASPQLATGSMLPDDVLSVQPFVYNTLPRTDKRSHYNYWGQQQHQQSTCPSIIYSTTDPHFLSVVTAEDASTAVTTAIDPQDSSWSSDHLYCNMASVDPLPSLPPRISRRCHSLLALASKTSVSEDADYENLQPESVLQRLHNVSHSRSRSLRHSGDFTPCWLPGFIQQQQQESNNNMHKMSSRRQQLLLERASRLELMLNDASLNDYSDMYEPSDWSMQATLSETVRDMDSVSQTAAEEECRHHCCCPPVRRAPHHCCHASSVRENAATQTEMNSSAAARIHRTSAAENPLYMAYNDLTKIDEYDPAVSPVKPSVKQEDYASDGCETWNSHQALYARLQQQAAATKKTLPETPKKRRNNKQMPITPSSSRIWRHEGQTVSTPQKDRSRRTRPSRSTNTTLDRTGQSSKSTRSQIYGGIRRRKSRKPKAADVLHGKGQLQLSIYLNSGLLTIHVQSARNLKSPSGRLCNTYVKVALIPDSEEHTFCRTTLIKNDNHPWYDQKFSFEFLSADLYKRLLISVWNRDSKKNRSEFMGCMSFSVSHVIRKDASGWYRLLNGHVGRHRHFAVRKQMDLNNSTIAPNPNVDLEEDLVVVDDDTDIDKSDGNGGHPYSISASVIPAAAVGKTPYTMSMEVKRGPKGYGFSVTWTHPPRIERVETGLAADLAGMRVGDYIVFVGTHNVVKMDEDQVLQLIQSAGDLLTLEVYRKNSPGIKPSSSEQLTMTQLNNAPANIAVQHGLINAETALALVVHRLLNHFREDSAGIDKRSNMHYYLSEMEKILEEHVNYSISTTNQLKSFRRSSTPLMIPAELHNFKRLLDRVNELLPWTAVLKSIAVVDLVKLFYIFLWHLRRVYSFLKALNRLHTAEGEADKDLDYFLDAFKVTLDKLEKNVGQPDPPSKQELPQSIVYASAVITKQQSSSGSHHWNVKDVIHQGFLWKRRSNGSETRFWALLFREALLFTHVNNGVHFVEEEPILLRNAVRLCNQATDHPSFRLVHYSSTMSLGANSRIPQRFRQTVVTRLRSEDPAAKILWIDRLQRQIDEGNKSRREEKTTGVWTRANSQQEEKIPHNGRKVDPDSREEPSCMSFGSLSSYPPCSAVAAPAAYHSATASHPASSYQSYSCDDLYLVVDLSAEGSPKDPADDDDGAEASVMRGCFKCTKDRHGGSTVSSSSLGREGGASDVVSALHSRSTSVPNVLPRAPDRFYRRWAGRLFQPGTFSRSLKSPLNHHSKEIASVTICLDPVDQRQPSQPAEVDRERYCYSTTKAGNPSFQSVLDTITEDDVFDYRMRQFHPSMNTDERHVLHSTGDSTETSPSWASASSSAMETPNDVDQPLAFDFSRKCELTSSSPGNPSDLRRQLVLPRARVASHSMPTTPEMSESSPSPRQVTSGIFRFPFTVNSSPRRFRGRAMSAEGNSSSAADDSASTAVATTSSAVSDSPGLVAGSSTVPSTTTMASQPARLRFPRFLRRTHSASASPDAPPYALFLRTKRTVSKTRSADMSGSSGSSSNEVFTSVDEAVASGVVGCRKTRLSEMRLRLGFLRRRSTESSLSARPPPEEAQKWSESFSALMASKYGAALYRAFLLREFSNENLEFWLAVEDYKSSKPQKMAAKAQKIYNDFVAVQAPKEVNLDAETRLVTLTNVQSNNPDQHIFDRAQRRIQHMMERDSYLRFLQSELFLELVHPDRYPASSSSQSAVAATLAEDSVFEKSAAP